MHRGPPGANDDTLASTAYTAETGAAIPALVAGRYQIVRWLGGGGMGRVYEVRDTELGERIALKMLRGNLDDEALERFRREVRLTRRIQHPNVARMFDIGEIEGERYLTMELVDGEALSSVLGAPMPWPRLREVAIQICAGLAAAHDKGILHRDLKPDNVMVERTTGRIVLTDFGIARSSDEANVTQTGMIVGTPRYMAPEQLAGSPTDTRADLFSLGVLLYELASGTRPWLGDNPISIAVAQATQPMRPLHEPDVPAGFVAIVEGLLAIDRDRRPDSAATVGAEISGLSGDPVEHETPRMPRPLIPPLAHAIAPPSEIESALAVLPFTCSPGDEYIADGMREDLIDMLSITPALRVRPAGALERTADPREGGRALGVDHVVIGSVRRTPTGLRVAARLIGVTDGFQIWAHRIDCGDAEVLAIGDQLGQAIATALSTRAANRQSLPTDPRAVELYLRARAELRRFWGEHALAASQLLEEAAAIAPNSGPIIGLLACATVAAWGKLDAPELFGKARQSTERALALDHPDAYIAAAQLHWNLGDLEQSARDTRIAIERAPMSALANETAGRLLMEIDPGQRARHYFDVAIGLDPSRLAIVGSDLARGEALHGDWESANRRVALLYADSDPAVRQFGAMLELRLTVWHGAVERVLQAVGHAQRAFAVLAAALVTMLRAYQAGRALDRALWTKTLTEIVKPDRPRRLMTSMLQRALEMLMVMREIEPALEALQVASDHGLADVVWLDLCPLFTGIDDPRWKRLRDQVAARAARALAVFQPRTAGTMLGPPGSFRSTSG